MKRIYSLFLALCLTMAASAQKATVSGTIIDNEGEPLPGATVVIMQLDSTQVTGQSTKTDGTFKIGSIKYGEYLLRASYVGYKTVFRPITLSKENKRMLLGEITLLDNASIMRDAVVTAQAAQVEMKADTFVYNADAFRVPAGSNFEALLKKFPGAEITEEGTIKINGKEVKRILVNKKEFFGNDTKMTLENIQANMVSKVKAYDRQSDYSRVTGIDDGEEETVLDLTIKEGMGKGWQVNLEGGYGTEDRYQGNLRMMRFNETWRAAVFGNANNTGSNGWGGWGRGGGGGLIETQTGGGDFAWERDKAEGEAGFLEIGGNVRYNHRSTDNLTRSNSQTFVTSTVSQFVNSLSQNFSNNSSLNGDFRIEWQPDTMTNIQFRPNFSYSDGDSHGHSSSVTFSDDPYEAGMINPLDEYASFNDVDSIRVNSNNRTNRGDNSNYNVNGWLQINRRLAKPGRNITLDFGGNVSESKNNSFNRSLVNFYKDLSNPYTFTNQYNDNPSKNWNWRARLSYSEPIFTGANLQFSYQFQRRFSDSDRSLYRIDSLLTNPAYSYMWTNDDGTPMTDQDIIQALALGYMPSAALLSGLRDIHNSQYATYNEYNHDASMMLRYQVGDFRLNAGVSFQPQTTRMKYNRPAILDTTVVRNVFNWAPRVDLRWKISNTSQWRLRYNGRMGQPSMTNLLDVEDTSDPLNISRGNPGLKPSWTNNFNTWYNNYIPDRQMGWNVSGGFSQTNNSISTAVIYDTTTGVRTSRPENISGNWNTWFWGGFNTALGAKKYWNISTNVNFNYNNAVGYMQVSGSQSSVKSTTKSWNIGDNLRLNYRYDWGETGYGIDFGLNGSINYQNARNAIQQNANLDTWSFNYGGNLQLTLGWGMTFSTDISQQSRRGYADESMNTNELIWNAQLQQSFLKERNLIVALEWYDILGERSNISRMISATHRSDTWTNNIYSYGMLRVIYNLNLIGDRESRQGFGGGFGPGEGGGRRGGGGGGFGGPGRR
ncbi:MAG: outer membrane beta-barrel protein [Bacteroidaceae bacterium]|nr:outer membrane beta-barrel protein [Bacteroidaceae bacterium]